MTAGSPNHAETFQIGNLKFVGKKPAYTHVRSIVDKHDIGDVLSGPEDQLFRALVELHPRAEEKVGKGIRSFIVDRALGGTLGIRIVRTDGSEDDLSLKKCIYGNESPRRRVMRALRRGIADDVAELKREWFSKFRHGSDAGRMRCAISKKYIRIDKGHMDHIPPMTFEVIVVTFLAHKGLTFSDIDFNESGLRKEERLRDEALEAEFRQWHANLAQMRFIADSQNHYDEEIVRIRRCGLAINASARSLRHREQARVSGMIYDG